MKKGIALFQVLGTITLLSLLLSGMIMSSQLVANRIYLEFDRIQAKENANAGLKVSLLRLKIFQEVLKKISENDFTQKNYINYIPHLWEFPIEFPLTSLEILGAIIKDAMDNFNKTIILTGTVKTTIKGINPICLSFFRRALYQDLVNRDESYTVLSIAKNFFLTYLESKREELLKGKEGEEREVLKNLKFEDFIEDLIYYTSPSMYNPTQSAIIERFKNISPKRAHLNSLTEILSLPSVPVEFIEQIKDDITVDPSCTMDFNKMNEYQLKTFFNFLDQRQVQQYLELRKNQDPFLQWAELETFLKEKMGIDETILNQRKKDLFDLGFNFIPLPTKFQVISDGSKGRARYVIEAYISIPPNPIGVRDREKEEEITLTPKEFTRFPRIIEYFVR